MVVLELSKLLKNYLKRRKWRHGEALQFLQFVRSLRLGQRSFDSQTHAFTYFPVSSSTVTLTVETSSHCNELIIWSGLCWNFSHLFSFCFDSPTSFLFNRLELNYRIFDSLAAKRAAPIQLLFCFEDILWYNIKLAR